MRLYTLTNKEVNKAIHFAVDLVAAGKKGTIENYIIGTLGEMGYAKHTNSEVNLEVYQRGKGDNGADFKGVQVKTTTWSRSDKELKVNEEDRCLKNNSIKKLVLMHTTLKNRNEVYLIGEVSKENFLKKARYNARYKTLVLKEQDLDIVYHC
jgi:hypothetical protein